MTSAEELIVKHDSQVYGMSEAELRNHATELRTELESALNLIDQMTGSHMFYSILKREQKEHARDVAEVQRDLYAKDRELDQYKSASSFLEDVVERAVNITSSHYSPRSEALALLQMQDNLKAGLKYFRKTLP